MATFTKVPRTASRVRAYTAHVKASYAAAFADGAERINAWQRSPGNPPWQDRTNAARENLTCLVEDTGHGFRLVNTHGVPYGGRLEFDYEGRFRFLADGPRRFWVSIMADGARRVKAGA